MEFVKKMAGHNYVGFSNATCVSPPLLHQVPGVDTGTVMVLPASLLT